MSRTAQFVVFRLDAQRYALPLGVVERIVPAAELTPLPQAPAVVSGVINISGRVLPVIDLRKKFKLPPRETLLTDQFLIAWTGRRTVVLVIDEVMEVAEIIAGEIVKPAEIVPGLELIDGVVKLPSGTALIHDLNRCLSLEEERHLEKAMAAEVTHGV